MIWFASLSTTAAIVLLVLAVFKLSNAQLQRTRRQAAKRWTQDGGTWEKAGRLIGLGYADRLCQHAGRPRHLSTGKHLLIWQFVFGLLFGLLCLSVSTGSALFFGGIAWYMPRAYLFLLAKRRRQEIALELPSFLDLWGLMVGAGEGIETAVVEICRRHPEWRLTEEMKRVRNRVSASGLFGDALLEEAKVTGSPELVAVAEQIKHLVDGGGIPSKELARLAEQMREQRVADLVQAAGAMNIVGVFPKVGAVFLSLAPILVAIFLTVRRAF